MPNRIIEIHDSVLEKILSIRSAVELHFSCVYIHQSEGRPGVDPGTGWIQRAILRIGDAKVHGAFTEFPVDLADGQIHLGEHRQDNFIPIPLSFRGALTLQLKAKWRSDEVVIFTGSSALLELFREPKYVEEFRTD